MMRDARASGDPAGSAPQGGGGDRVVPILNDGHVHFHGCFDLDRFFGTAHANFERAIRRRALPADSLRCLWLTENRSDHFFRAWIAGEASGTRRGWRFTAGADSESLVARHDEGPAILVMPGRQVRSREGLEVLALGTARDFADGLPFETALREVMDSEAVAVVPWGFGKWWLRRGALVARALELGSPGRLFLGDNGGRLAPSLRPRLFAIARRHGIAVLPGSDPLPFPREVERVASYGFVLEAAVDPARPGESLRQALRTVVEDPPTFGSRAGLLPFVRSQLAMQRRSSEGGRRS